MDSPSDEKYQARARIGVGASVGTVIGAVVAEIFYVTSADVLIGALIGAVIGGAIGSRMRSQSFQYIWIEYSPKVGIKLLVTGGVFTALLVGYLYVTEFSYSIAVQFALLAGILIMMIFVGRAMNFAISELDDVLKNVLKEAVVVGFITALCLFLTLGLVNQIIPFPSNWLFAFIILQFSLLIGRLYVGWKYR